MKSCRFEPTCSSYSLEAFKRFGFVIGLKLTVKRIIRCHPWGGHGYDPVPNFEEIKKECQKKKSMQRLVLVPI